MNEVRRQEVLSELRALVRASELANRPSGTLPSLPFGLPEIDNALPTGGLMLGAMHEVMGGGADSMHGAAATSFAGGVLARTQGPIIWTYVRRDLFAPALAGVGLHPDRVIYVEAGDSKTVLLVLEEALRNVGLGGVVGEVDGVIGLTASRRLQLAAEASGVLGLIIRRPRRLAVNAEAEPTAVRTRWRVTSLPSRPPPWSSATPGLARPRWQLDLLRCRGSEPRTFVVEASDAMGHLGLPADMANGSNTQDEQSRAIA